MNQSEHINELVAALAKAQAKMSGATKDKINPHFKSKYSSLAAIWEACRDALTEHGLAVSQPTRMENGGIVLRTVLAHSSGQWIASETPVIMTKQDPQGFGSAMTYTRRYALAALVGVASDDESDDDAEA